MNIRSIHSMLQAWNDCGVYLNVAGRPRPHFDGEALDHYLFMKELALVKHEVLHTINTAKEYIAVLLQFIGIATATATAMFIVAMIK